MQGGFIPFVAGCLFLAFGLLAMQGVVGTLWRSRRFRGRAEGRLVALETLDGRRYSKASDVPTGPNAPRSSVVVGLLIFFFNGNLAWLGPDWHR